MNVLIGYQSYYAILPKCLPFNAQAGEIQGVTALMAGDPVLAPDLQPSFPVDRFLFNQAQRETHMVDSFGGTGPGGLLVLPYITNNPHAATRWYMLSKPPSLSFLLSFLMIAPLRLARTGSGSMTAPSSPACGRSR
jgi:hypothetical protein